MRFVCSLAAVLMATSAFAEQQWLSAEDFASKVIGRATQIFGQDGTLYGTEYYLPKQRTIWQPAGQTQCYFGAWTARDGIICYRYQGGSGSCNRYYVADDRLVGIDWVGKVQTATSYNLTVVNEAPPTCSGT
jgi:hypothetical protein